MSQRVPIFLVIAVLATFAAPAQPLTADSRLAVRILYDNSGSMYPGYRPPGSADRQTRQELGVQYIHQSPEFAEWLNDFARQQSVFNASTVGMWTFTSNEQFTPSDIQEVHAAVPLEQFDANRAVEHFPPRTGGNTYLTETVNTFTRGFTGLVWLITDNIVEGNAGTPDAGVLRFFKTLAHKPELRSVHLLKYSFTDSGTTGAIAVYGILVSESVVPRETLIHYDGLFQRLSQARRSRIDADLFPGRDYLKLKDLNDGPFVGELHLSLDDGDKGLFKEGESIDLKVEGAIRSKLTQHTVTGGRYALDLAAPFVPEEWAQRDLGAQALESDQFDAFSGELEGEIPPGGQRTIAGPLQSKQSVSFSARGLVQWLRLAWSGATVRYTGKARLSFTDVTVRFESQRMAGIFGIDQASSAFEFQNVKTLPSVTPTVVPVSFALRARTGRTAILVILLAVVLAILAGLVFLLSRKRAYRIAISREPEVLIALRPLHSYDVSLEGNTLGRLSRGLFESFFFDPASAPGCTVTPTAEAEIFDVKLPNAQSRRLTIKAEGGGKPSSRKNSDTLSGAAPGGPPPIPGGGPPPFPGRAPRIGKS
jgi:hypothetical protein